MTELVRTPEPNTIAATLEQVGVGVVLAIGGIAMATKEAFEQSPAGFVLGVVVAGIGAVAAESGWHNRPR